jgi:diguanylate cyclase
MVGLLDVKTLLFISRYYSYIRNRSPLTTRSSVKIKLLAGISGGFLGNVLMHYSINIETTIIDLRLIPIILLAYFGGWVLSIISMLLIIGGRFLIGINISSYASTLLVIAVTLFSVLIAKPYLSKQMKRIIMLTFSNISASFLFLLRRFDH